MSYARRIADPVGESTDTVSQAPVARRPLADTVRDSIAADFILNNAVPPGELLPSEKDLSARYGVSRVTLRASMRSLQDAGLISIRHGVGSVVLARPRALTHGLDRLCSLETFAREAGRTVETRDLEYEELLADETMAGRLDVPEGHPVLAVRRTKVIGGVRVAWIFDLIPAGAISFERLKEEFAGSVLDVLLASPVTPVEYADCEIELVSLPAEIADRLGVGKRAAALVLDSVAYNAEGKVVEWAKAWLLPEHFSFSVRRRRQIGQ